MNCNLWLATRHWAEFAGGMHRSAILVGVLGAIVHGAALADAKAGEGKAILCDLCHNAGDHDGGLAPLLQAQSAPYLEAQLRAFKDGRRKGGGMETNASAMSDEDMRDISEYLPDRGSLKRRSVLMRRRRRLANRKQTNWIARVAIRPTTSERTILPGLRVNGPTIS
jgi:cytochrome c553